MKRKMFNGICIGLLMFWLIFPAHIVQAQWTVVEVNSTKSLINLTKQTAEQMTLVHTQGLSYGKQIEEYARLTQNWLKTVQHYTDTIFQMSRQFTSLNGILGLAEKQLGIDADKLKAAAEMIDGLRAVWAVKSQFENLLETRVALVKSWENRAKNGIFSPQADWQDLKLYLKTGLGRKAAKEDALLGKMTTMDADFARWQDELDRLRKKETEINIEIKTIEDELNYERSMSQKPRTVQSDNLGNTSIDQRDRVTTATERVYHLTSRLNDKEKQLQDIQIRVQELLDKMNKRYSELFFTMYEQWEKGANVSETGQTWETFGNIKVEKLGEIIDSPTGELPEVQDSETRTKILQ